jgi:argininosuccinate lyase
MNLIEGLQEEIKRVNEIIKEYDELPSGAGAFASAMMKGSIKIAEKAIANMDTVAMLSAIKDLKEYEL